MQTITALQHFYSRVSREQSPRRQAGFQTLYTSRGLTDEVIRLIETRAQYTSDPGEPVKQQFYPLPNDWIAIAQSVAIPELDEFGRKGIYLTHTLVVSQNDFFKIGAAPFDVLRQVNYATSLAQVFQACQSQGRAEPLELNLQSDWETRATECAKTWSPANLTALARLVANANSLVEKFEPITLVGADAEILDTLHLIFLLAPPALMTRLSFDTHTAGCDWVWRKIPFLFHGYATLETGKSVAHLIDAHARAVRSPLASADQTLYAQWVLQLGLHQGWHQWTQQKQWAQTLERFLTDPQARAPETKLPIAMDENFIARFARLAPQRVAECWATYFPPGLSPQLTWSRDEQWQPIALPERPDEYLKTMVNGIKPAEIENLMFMVLISLRDAPPKNDRQILDKWIKDCAHPNLKLMPLVWAKDGKNIAKSLATISGADYQFIVSWLLNWNELPVSLLDLLVEPHTETWIEICAPNLPLGEWKKALNTLAKMSDATVDQVANIFHKLYLDAQTEIVNWLKGYKGGAPNLRARAASVPQSKRFGLF